MRAPAASVAGARTVRLFATLAGLLLAACSAVGQPQPGVPATTGAQAALRAQTAPVLVPRIVARTPHDPNAFTQGLIVDGDTLIESTGQYGQSEVRRVRRSDGAVLDRRAIPFDHFGEGLARHGDELVSLTWRNRIAHRWDAATLAPRGTFTYPWQGWGLASDGRSYFLSDGSDRLHVLDPATFAPISEIRVTLDGAPVARLNELEWVDGRLLANVWMEPEIMVIDPATGIVTHVIDCRAIVAESGQTGSIDAVLNGIAWDARHRRLYVTGKLWPTLFEIEVPGLTD